MADATETSAEFEEVEVEEEEDSPAMPMWSATSNEITLKIFEVHLLLRHIYYVLEITCQERIRFAQLRLHLWWSSPKLLAWHRHVWRSQTQLGDLDLAFPSVCCFFTWLPSPRHHLELSGHQCLLANMMKPQDGVHACLASPGWICQQLSGSSGMARSFHVHDPVAWSNFTYQHSCQNPSVKFLVLISLKYLDFDIYIFEANCLERQSLATMILNLWSS